MIGVKRMTWRSPYSTFFFLGFLSKALPTMCNSKLHWDKHLGQICHIRGGGREKRRNNHKWNVWVKYLTTWLGHSKRRVKWISVALWTPSCTCMERSYMTRVRAYVFASPVEKRISISEVRNSFALKMKLCVIIIDFLKQSFDVALLASMSRRI